MKFNALTVIVMDLFLCLLVIFGRPNNLGTFLGLAEGAAAQFVERVVADRLTGKNNANENRLLARHAVDSFGFVHRLSCVPVVF
jgi:hypothetical protein